MRRFLLGFGASMVAAISAADRVMGDPPALLSQAPGARAPDGAAAPPAAAPHGPASPGAESPANPPDRSGPPAKGAEGRRSQAPPPFHSGWSYGSAYRPGYDPFGDWYEPYPYPLPYPPYYPHPYYYIAPLYLPAETLYGPEAVKRFMGVQRSNRSALDRTGGASRTKADDKRAEALEEGKAQQRGTNRESLALAWRFISFGDAHFANQKYSDSYQRYRKAAEVAPGLAEAYFRQVYALVALARYDQAAKALKRGLTIDPGWPRSGFVSDELYGPNQLAKTAHLEALARAAADDPNNSDLLLLLGVCLYFDGKRDRAALFLQRAAQLGADGAYLKPFQEQVK